jgi:hypothetical protein
MTLPSWASPRADPGARLGQGERLPVPQVRRRRHRARPRDAQHRRSDGDQRAVLDRLRQEPARRRHVVLPTSGKIFVSVADAAQGAMSIWPGGWSRWASSCSPPKARRPAWKRRHPGERVKKIAEGHPNLLDYMIDGEVQLVINTPSGKGARTDEGRIRAAAVQHGVPCITTIQAAEAAVKAMEALRDVSRSRAWTASPLLSGSLFGGFRPSAVSSRVLQSRMSRRQKAASFACGLSSFSRN